MIQTSEIPDFSLANRIQPIILGALTRKALSSAARWMICCPGKSFLGTHFSGGAVQKNRI